MRSDAVDYVNDFEADSDYSKFAIVTEKEFKTLSVYGSEPIEVTIDNTIWKISVTEPRAQKSYLSSSSSYGLPDRDVTVSCNYIASKNATCHAELLFISHPYSAIIRKARKEYVIGTNITLDNVYCSSVVIRILKKKSLIEKLADQWDPDVTFVVNGERCEANRQNLASASPVFRKMLFGKFAEAKQSEIVLEGIESADVFKDFVLTVSTFQVQPNPTNVLVLLKLAHQYDVPNLMRKCEEHLKFCYEIPIDDRIFVAAEYDLNDLKVHTAHVMTNESWKKMWKEHKEKLLNPEFVCLFDIIMNRWN
ncbi:BTB/POZ domain-containing protein [Ditylenchus destructor]|nr:BTB/POZ domain-containing protein [Ditylenchus destructor]